MGIASVKYYGTSYRQILTLSQGIKFKIILINIEKEGEYT